MADGIVELVFGEFGPIFEIWMVSGRIVGRRRHGLGGVMIAAKGLTLRFFQDACPLMGDRQVIMLESTELSSMCRGNEQKR